MRKTTLLKEMINDKKKMLVVPGAFDSLSAKIIERAGFDAVYITGQGLSGSLIGKPDIGLIGDISEIYWAVNRIGQAKDFFEMNWPKDTIPVLKRYKSKEIRDISQAGSITASPVSPQTVKAHHPKTDP